MGYGGGGGGGGGSGGSGGGSGSSGGSGYRRVGDDRTANLFVDNITNRDGSNGTEVDGIVEVNSTSHFIPPSGTTAERGSRGRGLYGGNLPSANTIEYVTIATLGNVRDFGDLSYGRRYPGALSSSTRAIFGGGLTATGMDYITISSTGNSFSFGSLTVARFSLGTASDGVRGVFAGGYSPSPSLGQLKNIEYVTIASKGNTTDFGEQEVQGTHMGSVSSPTRGIFNSRSPGTDANSNVIDYITIATTGNTKDFGDSFHGNNGKAGASSTTRGVFAGGYVNGQINGIEYVTMATLGNAIDFGDLTEARGRIGGTSNQIRGIFIGGRVDPTYTKTIDYVTIASTGNATDFGDTSGATMEQSATSDSHGGLG